MRVAVVGSTGAVGSTMLGVMRERDFPAAEVVPFASERSAGRTIDYGDVDLTVVPLNDETIQGFDLALFSAGGTRSAEWAPRFADAGVNIEMISTSPIKISCVVREDDVPTAVRRLHQAFELGADAIREEDPRGAEHRPRAG